MSSSIDETIDEIDRYGRQIVLSEWGAAGQERVRTARLTVHGSGPAAEAAALYLAGAGVGSLSLAPRRRAEVEVSAPGWACAIEGAADRTAVGAAVAVEALKAILGLPYDPRIDLPRMGLPRMGA